MRQTDRHTGRHRHTCNQADKQTDKQTGRQVGRQGDKQADTGIQTERQTGRQATCGQEGEVLQLVLVSSVGSEADLLLQVEPGGGVQVMAVAVKRLVQVDVVGPRALQVTQQRSEQAVPVNVACKSCCGGSRFKYLLMRTPVPSLAIPMHTLLQLTVLLGVM